MTRCLSRFVATLLLALVIGAIGSTAPTGAQARGCDAFATQEAAQATLDADLTDPNHLDTDFDGWACDADQPRPAAPEAPGFGLPVLDTAGTGPRPIAAVRAGAAGAATAAAGMPAAAIRAKVIAVIDGDTITVEFDDPGNAAFGQTRTIRLAGVAAGAGVNSGSSCFVAEAARRIDVMLPAGRTVYLEPEATAGAAGEDGFVWFKGKDDGESYLANEILVREGFAVVAATAGAQHRSRLAAAQAAAEEAEAGLWATCPEAVAPGSPSA